MGGHRFKRSYHIGIWRERFGTGLQNLGSDEKVQFRWSQLEFRLQWRLGAITYIYFFERGEKKFRKKQIGKETQDQERERKQATKANISLSYLPVMRKPREETSEARIRLLIRSLIWLVIGYTTAFDTHLFLFYYLCPLSSFLFVSFFIM